MVANSRVEAQTAAEAIEIDYEVLPSVVDPLEATKPGAPVVWPAAPDNIVAAMSYGDAAKVEESFAKAAHIVSLDLVSQRLIAVGHGAALDHCRDREEDRPAAAARAVADAGLDPRFARRSDPEAAEGQRARAGRRHRRRLWPEDQPLSRRRHRRLRRDETEQEDPLARRPHRRIRRRHPWPRPHLDRRIRARREGPRAGLSRALDRRHRRLLVRHGQYHPAGARPVRADRRLRSAAGAFRDQVGHDQHRAGRRLSRRGPARSACSSSSG